MGPWLPQGVRDSGRRRPGGQAPTTRALHIGGSALQTALPTISPSTEARNEAFPAAVTSVQVEELCAGVAFLQEESRKLTGDSSCSWQEIANQEPSS